MPEALRKWQRRTKLLLNWSTLGVTAIFTFAAANDIHTDDLDAVFASLNMNSTDVANAAFVYAWATNLKEL